MKKHETVLIFALFLAGCAAAMCGCTSATFPTAAGTATYRNSIFQKQFSELSVGTNGTLTIKGYTSEATSLVNAGSAAFQSGMAAAAKTALK